MPILKIDGVEVTVPAGAKSLGRCVRDLNIPPDTMLSLLIRKAQKPIMPDGDTVIEAEDQIIAVTPPTSEAALRAVLTTG